MTTVKPAIQDLAPYIGKDGAVDYDYLLPDVEKLIHHTCHRFVKQYGGDAEEYYAESCYWFVRTIVPVYNPDKGRSFSGWTRWVVFNHLLDQERTRLNRFKDHQRIRLEGIDGKDGLEQVPAARVFDMGLFKRSLSRDAAVVIHLTTCSWNTVDDVLNKAGYGPNSSLSRRKDPHPKLVKMAVARELRYCWDWSFGRIHCAFQEIVNGLE